jgi:hypothetical protein
LRIDHPPANRLRRHFCAVLITSSKAKDTSSITTAIAEAPA